MYRNSPAVKVTHVPTGIEALCESERSQHRNKAKALELLKARIYASLHLEKQNAVVRSYVLADDVTCPPDIQIP